MLYILQNFNLNEIDRTGNLAWNYWQIKMQYWFFY